MDGKTELTIQRLNVFASSTILSDGTKTTAIDAVQIIRSQDETINNLMAENKRLYEELTKERRDG